MKDSHANNVQKGHKKFSLSDDAADGVAALLIIALVVGVVVYWLETMT